MVWRGIYGTERLVDSRKSQTNLIRWIDEGSDEEAQSDIVDELCLLVLGACSRLSTDALMKFMQTGCSIA